MSLPSSASVNCSENKRCSKGSDNFFCEKKSPRHGGNKKHLMKMVDFVWHIPLFDEFYCFMSLSAWAISNRLAKWIQNKTDDKEVATHLIVVSSTFFFCFEAVYFPFANIHFIIICTRTQKKKHDKKDYSERSIQVERTLHVEHQP